MHQVHKLAHPTALDMPERFDPSGIPCADSGHGPTRAAARHRGHARRLPGLSPTALIASVEEVAEKGDAEWLVWGNAGNRPVLFAVEAGAAADMMRAVSAGEMATAIIEPWQLLLERLD